MMAAQGIDQWFGADKAGTVQRPAGAARQAHPVQKRAVSCNGRKHLLCGRGIDTAEHRQALFDQGNRNGPVLIAAGEGFGTVDRIDNPDALMGHPFGRIGGFFGQPAEIRPDIAQMLLQKAVYSQIGLGDRRAAVFIADARAGFGPRIEMRQCQLAAASGGILAQSQKIGEINRMKHGTSHIMRAGKKSLRTVYRFCCTAARARNGQMACVTTATGHRLPVSQTGSVRHRGWSGTV